MKKYALNSLYCLVLLSMVISSPLAIAAPKDNQQLTNDMAATQQSLTNIEADMKKLQRLLDNRAMLELFQRMDDIADEVSGLRGLLEQQSHDLAGLKKRQRELYLDTDRRLRDLEITSNRPPSAVVPAPEPLTENVAPPLEPVSSPPPPVSEKPAEASMNVNVPAPVIVPAVPVVTQTVSKPAVVTTSKTPTVSEERDAYQKAFDMLKEGRYQMASASFNQFINTYPTSSYAGNSQYWLGEANYVTRQFDQAVTEFKKVLEIYPTSNKAPDAMLKLGYTYYELRANDQAKTVLSELQRRYPKTTAARLAGKRLDRMRKEGL